MEKKCIILLGRSGGGKGTQAALLRDKLERDGYNPVHHITTGDGFRAFVKSDSYLASVARHVNDTGGLQPEFLAVWNWTNILNSTLKAIKIQLLFILMYQKEFLESTLCHVEEMTTKMSQILQTK
jgi:adenylate kinase family enzyme